MTVTIEPSTAHGRMEAPPSKSMAHRMLICAGCAEGTSVISNVDFSEDILATQDCLRALGAEISCSGSTVTIRGTDMRAANRPAALDCRECGSTLRFLIPLCLTGGQPHLMKGRGKLFKRPLSIYEKICSEQGLELIRRENELEVSGSLKSGEYEIPGAVSSQFVSGLLFALPLLGGDSRIRLIPPVESRSYIEMTIKAQKLFGVSAVWENEYTIRIDGGQVYRPRNVRVEGDYSNAAFFEALNLIGGEVTVEGLAADSLQGDRVYRQYFDRIKEGYAEIDLADCPDLGPVLMAAAALRHGAHFKNTRRLRHKESDRGLAMQLELRKMGVPVEISENEIRVASGAKRPVLPLCGHGDHRIVMALAVLLTVTGGSITGAGAVKKSLPDFWRRLRALGISCVLSDER